LLTLCAIALAGAPMAAAAQTPAQWEACFARGMIRVPQQARDALTRIQGRERQLLALRSYLRAGNLEARWSWSAVQIAAYERSAEYAGAMAALQRVQTRFAQLHPGYQLRINTQVRSLDVQIVRWNENASVGRASIALAIAARPICAQSPQRFNEWLARWRDAMPANLPDLSRRCARSGH
jgi:hypothetical protein